MGIFNVRITEDYTKRVIVKALNSFDIRTRQKIYTKGASDFKPITGIQVLANRNFTSNADKWQLGTGFTHSSGAIAVSAASPNSLKQNESDQANAIVLGKSYETKFTITNYVSGSAQVRVGNTGTGTSRSANGTFTETILAAGSVSSFEIRALSGDNLVCTLDSISCIIDSLADQTVSIGATKDVDISSMFSDPDVDNRENGIKDKLVITASSGNPDQCGASVYLNTSGVLQLKLTGYATGTPTITLTATDLHGGSVTQTIVVTVS